MTPEQMEERRISKNAYQLAWRRANPEKVKAYNSSQAAYGNAYQRIWRARNPAKVAASKKAYVASHQDQVRRARRAAYVRNSAGRKASARASYQKHAERVKARMIAWRLKHPEKVVAQSQAAYSRKKVRAVHRVLETLSGTVFPAQKQNSVDNLSSQPVD